MTLRLRLFLVLGGLAAALVLAQWWLVRSLSQDLGTEVDLVALTVGTRVASLFADNATVDECPEGAECERRIRVLHTPPLHGAGDGKIERHVEIQVDAEGSEGDEGEEREERREVRWVWRSNVEKDAEAPAPPIDFSAGEETTLRFHFSSTHVSDHSTDHEVDHESAHGSSRNDPETRFLVIERSDEAAHVPIPLRGLAERLEDFRSRLLLGSLGLLAVGLVAAAWIAQRVSAPLRALADAADEVGRGALGVQVDRRVSDRAADREVRRTVDAFDHMSRRLVELDARARRADALEHLGELGDVARGLAHTLRNPLNALGLSVEELAARTDADERVELAEAARRQIRRIDRGVRSFLVLASPTGGAVERVDLDELARDVALEALQDAGGRARIEVRDGAPGDETTLDAVEAELRAVVQALVVNAVEASPDGGLVEVGVESDHEDRIVLTVDDRGPGLPATVRERLFTPHLSTKSNGSGMGLFLAHRLAVHRYGGTLEILDREGGGTRARLVVGPRRSLEETPETPEISS